MLNKEKIKNRYEKINEHFDLKDLMGLSALIFGLLLSNSSLKTTAQAVPTQKPGSFTEQPLEKPAEPEMKKPAPKKKQAVNASKKRHRTVARSKKKSKL